MKIVEKILKEYSENVLDKHIKNPKTGKSIKVSSALTYDDSEPVKKAALAMVNKADVIVTPDGAKKNPAAEPNKNTRSHKPKSASYGISKECVEFLKKNGLTGLNAYPQSFVKPEEIKLNPAIKTKGKDSVWVAQFPFMLKNGEKAIKTVYTSGFMKKSQVKKYKKISRIKEKDIVSLEEKTTKLLNSKDKQVADSAAVIGIILKTGLRIGSQDAEESSTGNIGVRTLNKENVTIEGDKVNLKFIGKSYQENVAEFHDAAIANYLKKAIATSKSNRIFDCSYGHVAKVMDKINPKGINPKDIRTYKATQFAKTLLGDKKVAPPPLPKDKKQIKKLVKEKLAMVFDKVSKMLNNSPTMARTSYVHPVVITDYLNNLGLTPKFVGYKHVTLPEAVELHEFDAEDVEEDLNSSMDDFYDKYEDEYTTTTMDEMFEQNPQFAEGADDSDISEEDADDCEEYELPEWYYSDEWDLVEEDTDSIVESVINEELTEAPRRNSLGAMDNILRSIHSNMLPYSNETLMSSQLGDVIKLNGGTVYVVLSEPIRKGSKVEFGACYYNDIKKIMAGDIARKFYTVKLSTVSSCEKVGRLKPAELQAAKNGRDGIINQVREKKAELSNTNYGKIEWKDGGMKVQMQDGNWAGEGDRVMVKFSNGDFPMIIKKIGGTNDKGQVFIVRRSPAEKARGMNSDTILRKI
jgi:hypothetical protein